MPTERLFYRKEYRKIGPRRRAIIPGLFLAFFLGTAAASPPPPPQAVSLPLQQERLDAAITRLDELAETLLARSRTPGMAVAVVHRGELRYARGFGVRRLGEPAPVDADTVFQIASLSKSVTGTVVASQVGTGNVDWGTPIQTQLPWFQLADPWVSKRVSIGDLLAHRSGLPDHAGDDLEDMGHDRRTVLERLRLLPLDDFRASYAYTNFGFTAAALATAEAAGTTWADLAEQQLFAPLGMRSSSYRLSDFLDSANRAQGHIRAASGVAPGPLRNPDAQAPAGGMSSSIRDFARWMILVLGGGETGGKALIPTAALLPAVSPQAVSAPPYAIDARASFYGYGFNVGNLPSGHVALSHSGAFTLGAATAYLMLPGEELGIAVFTNAAPNGAAEALTQEFVELALHGEIRRDWFAAFRGMIAPLNAPLGELRGQAPPAQAQPPAELSRYTGRYHSEYFGPLTVSLEDGRLYLQLASSKERHRLTHWDGDTFTMPLFTENAPKGSVSTVHFERKNGKRINAATIELIKENELAYFER